MIISLWNHKEKINVFALFVDPSYFYFSLFFKYNWKFEFTNYLISPMTVTYMYTGFALYGLNVCIRVLP